MSVFASSWVDWNALGRITLAAFVGGGGVVVAFGLMLLGLERARVAESRHLRLAHRTLAGACGVCCIGALLIGIYAMTDKPLKHPSKPKSAALAAPAHLAAPDHPARRGSDTERHI